MTDIGHTKLYPIPESVKSILKIHGDFSFFAIPTDLLNKYGIESFEIIKDSDKIMLVAQKGAEQANESNKPTSLKEVLSNVKWIF